MTWLQVFRAEDLVDAAEVAWYQPLDPDVWRWEMLTTTRTGRACSRQFAWCLEKIGIAPKGTSQVCAVHLSGLQSCTLCADDQC